MRKFAIALIPCFVLVLTISLVGCAKPPTVEMEAAEEALLRAENDPDAAAYAEGSLVRARTAITRMREEAQAKRYDAVKAYAAEAVSAAEKAINDGRAAAFRAREEAASLIAVVKDTYAETKIALDAAKQNSGSSYDDLSWDLNAVSSTIAEAEAALAANRIPEALGKGRDARAYLGDIQASLAAGARETTRKK
jgi:flagellar biosynthesis/type III secretory pathway protein FliH